MAMSISIPGGERKDYKRVLLAVDADNLHINRPCGTRINYAALVAFARKLGNDCLSFFYAASARPARSACLVHTARQQGYTRAECRACRNLPNGKHKSDVDVKIAVDVLIACSMARFDIFVLASGDGDFLPLLDFVASQGTDIYVIGPDHASSTVLRNKWCGYLPVSAVPGLALPWAKA